MREEIKYIKRVYYIIIFSLTLLFALMIFANINDEYEFVEELAKNEAKASYEKDILYRRWATEHGGVYVWVTKETQPNPYLKYINNRDLKIDSGRTLTLINPAYMTRQVFELAQKQIGSRGHITSLNPIRKENKADSWETEALKSFERGEAEATSISQLDSAEYFRYMRPMFVEQKCLKCHAHQGYETGQIRGGISVSVPMRKYYDIAFQKVLTETLLYIALFLILLIICFLGFKRIRNYAERRIEAQEKLKKSESLLKKQNVEYEFINKELEEAKWKAEESDRLKSAFLVNLSHEIRTPMNGIMGFVELLKEPNLKKEDRSEFLDVIDKSSTRLLNVINDLIDISKVDSGEAKLYLSEFNLNSLIDIIQNLTYESLFDKEIRLNVVKSLSDSEAMILSDKEKLMSVLMNLLKNAIKFSNPQGLIEMGYCIKGDQIEFFVYDDGIGIPKEKLDCIFDRFVQVDTSLSRKYDGSGLGLSIAKGFVNIMGGEIRVESELNKGSQFYFTIPFMRKEVSEIVEIDKKAIVVESEKVDKSIKIMIVDDDEMSDKFLTILIERFASEILHADDGSKAIELSRQHSDIDIILMDIRMQNVDGYEATKEIRKFNKDVVIIAQTANALKGDYEKAIDAGCNDYLTKPIDKNALEEKIFNYLNKFKTES